MLNYLLPVTKHTNTKRISAKIIWTTLQILTLRDQFPEKQAVQHLLVEKRYKETVLVHSICCNKHTIDSNNKFWSPGSPRSRRRHVRYLVEANFLVHRWPSSLWVPTRQKGQGLFPGVSLTVLLWGFCPHDLNASQRFHLIISSHCGFGFSRWI